MTTFPLGFASRTSVIGAAGIALALIACAYWPGLSGPFLFDDFVNLNVIGAYGRIADWPTFFYYVTAGNADPTGRPVSLLTFLLDAREWPASPFPFKRTNLVLHLINTALLALAAARLQAGLEKRRPDLRFSRWTPLLAAVLWGAHPFFVSTTMYVVQRQAMLPMTFVLLALLAWDHATRSFAHQRIANGWTWAIIGMGGATVLATFSKANGLLAPLLVGLAYLWFLRPSPPAARAAARAMDTAAVLCLAIPSMIVLAYLLKWGWQLWSVTHLQGRDWTISERLLSQPRALWTYLCGLVLPRSGGGGLFVEDFAVSRGWMDPMTTLPALLALLASAVAAIAFRHRFPIASFAWLFFLAGHLLEGSTIPLELYFEHRNYLPAMFLAWPLAHALLLPGTYSRGRIALAALLVAMLLFLTYQRALVWGNEALLHAMSAEYREDSPRSQSSAAQAEVERGDVEAGLARIHAMQRRFPDSIDIAINAIALECQGTGALSPNTLARTRNALATAVSWNRGLYLWMHGAATDPGLRRCQGFGLQGLKALIDSAEANPQSASALRRRDLWHARGRVALADGQPAQASHWFEAALRIEPDAEYALVQAAALGDANAEPLGVEHLDLFARIEAVSPPVKVREMGAAHAWLLRHYGYHDKELSSLRARLAADVHDQADAEAPPR